jgi:platelet-activating factor acetylhydrolase IB subunit beta/gamma
MRSITAQPKANLALDVILIGDSLVEGWDIQLLSPLAALDSGVGGDRTENVLWRLLAPGLSEIHPKNVVVLLGTNNLAAGDDACSIASGLQRVATRLHELWPQSELWFIEIPPRFDQESHNEIRIETNKQMRSIPSIKTINVDQAMTCDGGPCTKYAEDKLHFSGAGYEALSQALKAKLQ